MIEALPSRSDFTSLPRSAMPASILSSSWNLCRARRLVATSPPSAFFDFLLIASPLARSGGAPPTAAASRLARATLPLRLALAAFGRQQVDAAARLLDAVDADPDRVAHADRGAVAGSDQHRLGRIELVALAAADQARRQEPFVDIGHRAAEADEGAAADHALEISPSNRVSGPRSNSSRRSRKAAQTSSPARSSWRSLARARSTVRPPGPCSAWLVLLGAPAPAARGARPGRGSGGSAR